MLAPFELLRYPFGDELDLRARRESVALRKVRTAARPSVQVPRKLNPGEAMLWQGRWFETAAYPA